MARAYAASLRNEMIQKLRSPRGPSAVELAEKVGVHHGTLSRWLKEATTLHTVTDVRATRPRLAEATAASAALPRSLLQVCDITQRERGLAIARASRMTLPRCVLPGQTVMVTRRCLRRTKLLRPDAAFNQLYTYCLAVMASRHDVAVHAVVIMSTHEHLIVTDTHGRLPLFLRELHRLVALGVKVLRRWEGSVWDHERPSVVHLRTQQAVIEKLAYVMANPVEAGLVARAEHGRA
jgi:REP element-mobilizing transposase RayT